MKLSKINLLMHLHSKLQLTSDDFTTLSENLWEFIHEEKTVDPVDLVLLERIIKQIQCQANELAKALEPDLDKEEA
jgi:hypothetical protein